MRVTILFTCILLSSFIKAEALFKFKNEYAYKKTMSKNGLNIFYINKANLYMTELASNKQRAVINNFDFKLLDHNKDFQDFSSKMEGSKIVKEPSFTGPIIYKQSELLLQESIREILQTISGKAIDFVLFGGDQVYSNEFSNSFNDIASDLSKFSVPFYQVEGINDRRGPIQKLSTSPFYLLKSRGVNIIVLDNVEKDITPIDLPAGATLQYIWIKKLLEDIKGEDILVFSYKALSTEDKFLFQNNKVKLFINSEDTNVQLSSYPCSYLQIYQDHYGAFKTKVHEIGLEQIQSLAKKRQKS